MRLQYYFDRIQSSWKKRLTTVAVLSILAFWMILPALGQPSAASSPDPYPQVELSLALTVVSIDAEITQATQTTQLSIRSIGSPLEEIEFLLPVAEFAAVEQAIAQELNLAPSIIHQLIRYRLN